MKAVWIFLSVIIVFAVTCFALQFSLVARPLVKLALPLSGSGTYMTHPHFRWMPEASADRYEIQIARDANFQSLERTDSIPVPRYVPLDELPAGNSYWWRVRPQLYDGTTGSWSPSWKITVSDITNVYTVSTNDSLQIITNTLAAAANTTAPVKIIFEPGIYQMNLPDDAWLLKFENRQDMVIDGQGAVIVLNNPRSGFFYARDSHDILVRRFTVDFALPDGTPITHTAGYVTAVYTNGIAFEPMAGHLPPNDPVIRDASSRRWGCLMDPDIPGRLKINVPNVFDFEPEVTALGSNQYRLALATATQSNYFKIGDILVKNAAWGKQVLSMVFCSDITCDAIIAYSSSAPFYAGSLNDGMHFLRCEVRIKPGRRTAVSADGFIGFGHRTGYWIEACQTEGLLDDTINCSGYRFKIASKPDPTTVVVYGWEMSKMVNIGDHLTLYNPPEGQVKGTYEVLGLTPGSGNLVEVKLSADPGIVYPGTNNWDSQLFVEERANEYAYIRHNTFQNSRRLGCRIRAHNAVIEGNRFVGLSDQAIDGCNICVAFSEGLDNKNLRILDNYIEDCGSCLTFFGQDPGAINIGINAYGTVCTQTVHQSIEIRGNEIYDWDGKGISVQCAGNVQIVSNTIKQLSSTNFFPGGSNYGICLKHTDGAKITGNDLRDIRPMNAAILIENSTNYTVSGNQVP